MNNIPLVLDINNASFGIGDKNVLEGVDFALADGEICYLTGKSGSGKSTFLKTLYGATPLKKGSVNIAGFELNGIDRKTIPMLRRDIGMVFQEFHLFYNWSVGRNLNYVLKATEWKSSSDRNERVREVLTQVGLLGLIDRPVHELSGGEQQKIVIARSILNRPKIIIADEPTGNLDPQSSGMILKLLYDVAVQNKTAVLIATHDQLLIEKFSARTFALENKKIIEI